MTEESVKEEIAKPQEMESNESPKSDKEINFGKLRKKLESVEEKNSKLEDTINKQNELLERFQSAFQKPNEPEESFDPDDFVTGRTLSQWEKRVLEEAEKRAEKKYEQKYKQNFAERLAAKYQDYDEVVTAENAKMLEQTDPEFAEALADISDEYKRREMAYKKIKKLTKQKGSAQEAANENLSKNYYYTPQGQQSTANPYAFEFDVSNPEARKKAYQKLKAGQKRGF